MADEVTVAVVEMRVEMLHFIFLIVMVKVLLLLMMIVAVMVEGG